MAKKPLRNQKELPLTDKDERAQGTADAEWWRHICKLLGVGLSSFIHRHKATIIFDCDFGSPYVTLDGRIAAYIIAQAEEREAFNQRVLKDLKKLLKDFQVL